MADRDDESYRRPGRDNPIYQMATGLTDLQLSILEAAYTIALNP